MQHVLFFIFLFFLFSVFEFFNVKYEIQLISFLKKQVLLE